MHGGVERLKTNWCRDDREFGGGINDGVVLQLHVDDAGAARYACKSWSSAATFFSFLIETMHCVFFFYHTKIGTRRILKTHNIVKN